MTVLEDERALARGLTGDPGARTPERDALLTAMARRSEGRTGRRDGILVHSVRQDILRAAEPWPVKFSARDLATRVVRHLDSRLAAGEAEPLGHRWDITRGIETGADAFSRKISNRVKRDDPKDLPDSSPPVEQQAIRSWSSASDRPAAPVARPPRTARSQHRAARGSVWGAGRG